MLVIHILTEKKCTGLLLMSSSMIVYYERHSNQTIVNTEHILDL